MSLEAFPAPDEDVDEVQCLYSIAVSLKRIADALSLPGPDKGRMNLAEVIEGIQSYGTGQHR